MKGSRLQGHAHRNAHRNAGLKRAIPAGRWWRLVRRGREKGSYPGLAVDFGLARVLLAGPLPEMRPLSPRFDFAAFMIPVLLLAPMARDLKFRSLSLPLFDSRPRSLSVIASAM